MPLHKNNFKQTQESVVSETPLAQSAESQGVKNPGRRKLTGIGLGVPVVLTLASRSVLAGQCLSNMLSGNLSDPDRDSNCNLGWSPGQWGTPGGKLGTDSTEAAWAIIGFTYGAFKTRIEDSGCYNNHGNPKTTNKDCYKGGSTVESVPSVLIKEIIPSGTPIRDILQDNSSYKLTRHLICAYFNACYGDAKPEFNYIMTKAQVLGLADGSLPLPPGYANNLQAFLASTWI